MKKIDIYNHVFPPAYFELVKQRYKDAGIVKRLAGIRVLWDMEARVEMLKLFPDVQQAITLALPGPEGIGSPQESPGFARVANDGMAEICAKYPNQFPWFIAALPM